MTCEKRGLHLPQEDDLTLNGDYTATFTPDDEWAFYMRRPNGTA